MAGRPTNEPNNYLALGFQSAKDTEATTFEFIKHLDGSGFDTEPDVQYEREGGDGQESGLAYIKSIRTSGAAVANSRAVIAGKAAAAIGGADSASILASGALNFHRQIPTSTQKYLTVEQRSADEVERTTNAKFTQVEITAEAGRPYRVDAQFVSGGSTYARPVASALTPTRESVPPHYYHGASHVLVIGGASVVPITKWKATIKRGVDNDIQTTGLNPEDAIELNFECDLDGTFRYEDRNAYAQVKYAGGTQVPFDLATGNFNAFSANGSWSDRLCMPLLDIVDAKVNRLDPDGKTMYVDFVAHTRKSATTTVFGEQTVGWAATAAYTA